MSVSKALQSSVENSIIDLVLRRGCPVVEEGKENPALAAHGFAASAWKDTTTESHIKGGASYDEHSRRWISFDGCKWDYRDAVLTKDEIDEETGKVTFEVEGLLCNCGQYSSQKVRFTAPKDKMAQAIALAMQKVVFSF